MADGNLAHAQIYLGFSPPPPPAKFKFLLIYQKHASDPLWQTQITVGPPGNMFWIAHVAVPSLLGERALQDQCNK